MARSSTTYERTKGSNHLRQRLLLVALVSTPIIVEDNSFDHTWPKLLHHEISLLGLFERLFDDCSVEINETGITYDPNDASVDAF